MARARLWEDTLILALRDWQWLCQASSTDSKHSPSQRPTLPPGLVKLDGNAESKIGDVVTSLGDARFFIVEVKSERRRIRGEWVKKGLFHPKLVYQRLKSLVDECNKLDESHSQRANHSAFSNLWRSIACHYFLYWTGVEKGDCVEGHTVLEPYILGAAAERLVHEKTKTKTMRALRSEITPRLCVRDKATKQVALNSLKLARINTAMTPGVVDEPLGLTGQEFEHYLRFLCTGEADGTVFEQWESAAEDVHVVVLSDQGGFFRVFTDTNQLANLIDGKLRPQPRKDAIPQPVRVSQEDPINQPPRSTPR